MEMNYVYMTDSDSDLPYHLKAEYDIPVVYMPYALDGKELLSIGTVKETFETGDFSAFPWQTLGSSHWFIDNTTANAHLIAKL